MILPGYTRPSRLKRFIRVLLGIDTDFDEYTFSIKRGSLRTILKTLSTQSAELDALRGEVEKLKLYNVNVICTKPDADWCRKADADEREAALKATIAQLREENAALAAGACDQGDRGMIGDDHGHFYCAMAVENTKLRDRVAGLEEGLGQAQLALLAVPYPNTRARDAIQLNRALLTQNEVG